MEMAQTFDFRVDDFARPSWFAWCGMANSREQSRAEKLSASTRYFQSLIAQSHSMPTVLREEHDVTSLGDIPLLVLVATEPDDAIRKVWSQANIEMAALSTNGSYQIVNGATHISLAYREGDAQACADGILQVLNASRNVQASQ
jgi:hypothetical protein